MRALTVGLFMLVGLSPALADACRMTAEEFVRSSPGLTTTLTFEGTDADGTVRLAHPDDARIGARVSTAVRPVAEGATRSGFERELERRSTAYMASVGGGARQVDATILPFDPVGWQVFGQLDNDVVFGHTQFQVDAQCVVSVDFAAPSSPNLRSRWHETVTAVSELRQSSSIIPVRWAAEDTAPADHRSVALSVAATLLTALLVALAAGAATSGPVAKGGPIARSASAAVSVAALAWILIWGQGFTALRGLDTGAVLSAVALAGLAGAAVGGRAVTVAFALATAAAGHMAFYVLYGWSNDPAIYILGALALQLCVVIGSAAALRPHVAALLGRAPSTTDARRPLPHRRPETLVPIKVEATKP